MMYQTKSQRIFGIDPGLANCGWAVVVRNRSGKFVLLDSGCIVTSPAESEASRLLQIYQQISELLHVHCPNSFSIERVFHNKNVSSSLKTAQAIGVIQVAAEQAGVDTKMFTPQQVKAAVCGHGGADKASVKKFVEKLTGTPVRNRHAADAVAVAIAGLLDSKKMDVSKCGIIY